MIKNEDLEKMILRELVLTPVLEFIVDKFVEELLKEDEIEIMAPLKTPKPHDLIYANSEKETNSSKTPCVGSYPVNGYTRSDGTEVSAYTRTCGAKHLPKEKENKNNSINTNYNTPFELKVEYNQTLPEYNQVDTKSVSEKYQGLNLGQMALKIMSKLFVNMAEFVMYFALAIELADKEKEELDITNKQENDFYKLKDITDKRQHKIYMDKVAQMYKMDTKNPNTYKIIEKMNVDIVMPKIGSRLYNLVKNAEITKMWIAKNYEKFKNGTYKGNNEKSATYPLTYDYDGFNLFAIIHNTDIENFKINSDNSVSLTVNDGYNFEKLDKIISSSDNTLEKFKTAVYNLIVEINNQAYDMQQKNQLKPYVLTIQLHYTKDETDDLLKQYK